ncbi:MAG: CoA transferase [Deltaproteobacteria bacterium]|nr:CoA transferase [Deltaproteobacteria bacterium]
MSDALKGIKVLDLSMFLSGPRTSQLLADFGAEVVKVEPPEGETMRLWMMMVPHMKDAMTHWHRNKKCISLNIRNPEGADLLRKMVGEFDVLIENLAPGTLDKLGLSYNDLIKVNPRLIYCSISGFGKDAPYSHRVAFDIIAQATGGIMSAMGLEHRPPGVFFGDLVSGAYAAMGILTALRHRDKTGEGQLVDISMQDVMYFHNFAAIESRMKKDYVLKEGERELNIIKLLAGEEGTPMWRSYKAKDGYVAMVFLTDRQWKAMCDIMGHPEYKDDPRFSDIIHRVRNGDQVEGIINEFMKDKSADEIEKALDEARIPCGQVRDVIGVNDDPNLVARGMIDELEHEDGHKIPLPGIPIKLSKSPGKINTTCPEVGENNEEIYKKYLGFSEEDVRQLKEKGAI